MAIAGGRTPDRGFWTGRRVLITGHTGFKGGWASLWLSDLGAQVTGFALEPEEQPNLFELGRIAAQIDSRIGDLRDRAALVNLVGEVQPDMVLHLGAQSLVRRGYASPLDTFATNTLGTANLLEAVRLASKPCGVLIVTTDKVYENIEDGRAFTESDALGGHDPYSASKAAAELVTLSYARSFFASTGVRVATARGGNVIGGGDFSPDRLVPDVWRAAVAGKPVTLRYPDATRPWQHVLDCLCGYLVFLEDLAQEKSVPHTLNFAPENADTLSVRAMVERLQMALGARHGQNAETGEHPREMRTLHLSSEAAMETLNWRNRLAADTSVAWTVEWYRALAGDSDMRQTTLGQIASFMEMA